MSLRCQPFKLMMSVPALYNSTQGSRSPALSARPVRLSGSSSLIHSGGNGGRMAAAAFARPGVGNNLVQNGDFESGSLAPWAALGNHSASAVSSAVAFEGGYSLRVASTGAGAGGNLLSQSVSDVVSNLTYTFSFWYLPSVNGSGISFRLTTPFRSQETAASGLTLICLFGVARNHSINSKSAAIACC